MIDLTEWANGSHNSFGDAIYMATWTTALVLAVGVVVWRLGKRLILHATHRLPQDAKPLSEDTGFVVCLAFAVSFGMLLTLNPRLLVIPKDTTFTEQVAQQAGLEALSCPTVYDSKYMPPEGRYECEYVDAKGKAHDCDPVDACECPCCLTVFRVRTLMTDGAGRLMRDEYETIPMFCPMCGGRLEQSERKE